MSLDTARATTETQPGSVFDATFPNWALASIGMSVPYGKDGVIRDIDAWLAWMLRGGTRPRANKRSTNAEGVNALAVTQDFVCAALDGCIDRLNFHDPEHYALIERATRPLPGNVPLV